MAKSFEDLMANVAGAREEVWQDRFATILIYKAVEDLHGYLQSHPEEEDPEATRAFCYTSIALGACYRELDRLITHDTCQLLGLAPDQVQARDAQTERHHHEMIQLGTEAGRRLFALTSQKRFR